MEQSCTVWFKFVAKYMTAFVLLGIGATYVTDLSLVINTLSIANTLQVITVVLDAGLGGVPVGFHFIESDVSAGLFMANMGGAGNVAVAVLLATRRMVLMPFARIPFRLDGVLILALVGLVAPLLMR
ncbi:MAG: 2-hydroxycarboxylate transporter family protein [Desulfovibrio sp.]|uniref:2-hydroxycarboxylate transporter family protein n=1 Tax=Desulfovibrio sp. TaxID=885 RepID=UPI002585621B|nr:2-hydroxycarboxylate transporter family protein [Desulfovibrio sp.]MCD7984824.1 2-hydroxycarboxylate transporter family protein [Desulfovibrio sp.]